MLPLLKTENITGFAWKPRESNAGEHGMDGEDNVFCVTFTITQLGVAKEHYLKGYFFTRTSRDGVTIQSFKKSEG